MTNFNYTILNKAYFDTFTKEPVVINPILTNHEFMYSLSESDKLHNNIMIMLFIIIDDMIDLLSEKVEKNFSKNKLLIDACSKKENVKALDNLNIYKNIHANLLYIIRYAWI